MFCRASVSMPCALLLLVQAAALKPPTSSKGNGLLLTRRIAFSSAVATSAAATIFATEPASGLGLTAASFGLKQRRKELEACYEALECADDRPAYDMICERDDIECLDRRRRKGKEDVAAFIRNPGGFTGVAAILAFGSISRFLKSRRRP